jgi:hypothetical protein
MNVHILHELYSNSVTKRVTPYSSMKKAKEQLNYLLDSAKNVDGWTVEPEHMYMDGQKYDCFKLVPPSKNVNSIVFLVIYTKEVL